MQAKRPSDLMDKYLFEERAADFSVDFLCVCLLWAQTQRLCIFALDGHQDIEV